MEWEYYRTHETTRKDGTLVPLIYLVKLSDQHTILIRISTKILMDMNFLIVKHSVLTNFIYTIGIITEMFRMMTKKIQIHINML